MALRPGRTSRQTLDYLIALYTPEIRDVFIATIQDIVDEAIISEMIAAIERGDPEAAFRAIGFSQAALNPLIQVIERAFERGGVYTGSQFPHYLRTPSGLAVFRFDVRNSRAEGWLRDHSAQLVTRLSNEALTATRTTLETGMRDGRNPRNVALDLVGRIDPTTQRRTGGIIGLTPGQVNWVNNTRRDLVNLSDNYFTRELRDKRFDATVRRAIATGQPLSAATIDKLITAYKNNTLRYRGETIGRTEAMQALNRSQHEAYLQAVDTGALRKQDIVRVWDSAGDSRVRWSHKRMDEQKRGIDDAFVSPSGARMMFPGDTSLGAGADEVVMCRCRVRLEVDFLAQWDDED